MAVTDIAGGAFCHADVRVGGIKAAERKRHAPHSAMQIRRLGRVFSKLGEAVVDEASASIVVAADTRFVIPIRPTIELGMSGSHQNAAPATAARGHPWPERMAVTDDAGAAFCHADVRVGRIGIANEPSVSRPEGLHYF